MLSNLPSPTNPPVSYPTHHRPGTIPGMLAPSLRRVMLRAVLLLATLYSAPASSEEISRYIVDTGPVRIRDQFLLGMGFLAFDPVSADVQRKGGWQFDTMTTLTNTFAHSDSVEDELDQRPHRQNLTLDQLRSLSSDSSNDGLFYLDGELIRTALAARRGLGKGVQLEIVVPILNFQGGILDSTIEGFHNTFSFGQAGRTGVPKDSFLAYANSKNGELFVENDPGVALGDVVVGAKFDLLGGRPSQRPFKLALETLVKLPTGDQDQLSSSGSADFGAQILLTRYFKKACLHTSFGLLQLGEWEELGTPSQTLPSMMVAYERSLGAKTSGLIQLTVSESPFRDLELNELAASSIQVTLGIKKVIFPRHVLFVGLTENVQNYNNTSDIGLHIGLTQTF